MLKHLLFKKVAKSIILLMLTALMLYSYILEFSVKAAEPVNIKSDSKVNLPYYDQYISACPESKNNEEIEDIVIPSDKIINIDELNFKNQDGKNYAVITEGKSGANLKFNVLKNGLYYIIISYYVPLSPNVSEIGIDIKLNNIYPFYEARSLNLSKQYVNETNKIMLDENNNQIRPKQVENPSFSEQTPYDKSGFNSSYFYLYLEAGENNLTLSCNYGSFLLNKVTLKAKKQNQTYEQYIQKVNKTEKAYNTEKLIEAEAADYKSSPVIYPKSDRDDALTSPSNSKNVRLNMLSFDEPGQKITYTFDIEDSGLYEIDLRVRQRKNRGIDSFRRIYIDGDVLFSELDNVEFPYSNGWYIKTLGDKKPYNFYFSRGKHTISIECHTGYFAKTLFTIQTAVLNLNEILRNIVMVTGVEPDTFRDYDFKSEIPQLEEKLKQVKTSLESELSRLYDYKDFRGSEISTVEDVIRQLESFIDNQRSIPSRLDSFRSNISSLSVWINTIKNQYLELDYISIHTPDKSKRRAAASFLQQMKYNFESFISSFASDINNNEREDTLSVWVNSGRDQANIINRMINDDYVKRFNKNVKLSLVDTGPTLLQAVLANKGPDVALFVTEDIPVNLAARNSLVPMDDFIPQEKLLEKFYPSALKPYIYEGKCYAMPNSQLFNMMFYRKDIFEELKITPPKTWDEFYDILPVIQRNNMQVGAGGDSQLIFESLIFQNGGKYFNNDLTQTNFNSMPVLNAFKTWTGFYTKYQLPLTYDFFNRFRSGEMPLAIMPYTQYNMLNIAAPEIRGLWEMTAIPGIKTDAGSINFSESATGTGSIIIKDSKLKETAFKFLEWWSSDNSQVTFANELESVMGPAARFEPANKNILEKMRWSKTESSEIRNQWENVDDIEILPSTYYITRNVTNAYRDVIYNFKNEREVLNKFSRIIDTEIARKNNELSKYRK